MNTRAAIVGLTGAVAIAMALQAAQMTPDCSPTPRMSYEASSAIKRSLLPPGALMSDYILDHIVPLCMGGSNDRSNLQLQTQSEAARKDEAEFMLCREIRRHKISCQEARKQMMLWK
jgi:hypothetical protein